MKISQFDFSGHKEQQCPACGEMADWYKGIKYPEKSEEILEGAVILCLWNCGRFAIRGDNAVANIDKIFKDHPEIRNLLEAKKNRIRIPVIYADGTVKDYDKGNL